MKAHPCSARSFGAAILTFAILAVLSPADCRATFSIDAVDSYNWQVGSAGASCISGAIILSDVHPGVGVVHTQAYWNGTNQAYARSLMDRGIAPQAIIDSLVAHDAQHNPSIRQYGIVDPVGKDLERERQKPVARENGRRFIERLVASRPAPSKIVVVHRRQVIVDERVGVDHLHRGRGASGIGVVMSGDQLATPEDQGRADALARPGEGVAKRFQQIRLDVPQLGKDLMEDFIDDLDLLGQRGVEAEVDGV